MSNNTVRLVSMEKRLMHYPENQQFLRARSMLALLFAVTTSVYAQTDFTDINAGLPGIGGSRIAWGDFDNDGDLDFALVGNELGGNGGIRAHMYRNDGGTFVEITTNLHTYEEGMLEWGDYNCDGQLDIAQTGWDGGGTGARIYRGDGAGNLTFINAGLRGMKQGDGCWADFDGDGRPDLLIIGESYDTGDGNYAQIYRNLGNDQFSLWASFPGLRIAKVAIADFNNDGRMDILMAGLGVTQLYRNDGVGVFTLVSTPFPGLDNPALAWGDFDCDGYPDLALSGNVGSVRYSAIFHNEGGTSFTNINAALPLVEIGAFAWGDYDNDGYLDLAMCGYTGSGTTCKIFRNSSGTFVDSGVVLPGVYNGDLRWGDFDNDGRLDLAITGIGDAGKLTRIYKNAQSITANVLPTAPSGLSVSINNTTITLNWNAASDTETPTEGLSYNVRVGTAPGKEDIVGGMANLTTGLRKVVAFGNAQSRQFFLLNNITPGTYYWSVQAIDSSFAGSAWTTEGSFLFQGPTTTTASNASITYNDNAPPVTLSATVTSPSGIVNEGTVTFQIMDGATNIGTAVTSSTVTSGAASVSYPLPPGTPAKIYSIQASYSGALFSVSSDTSKTLTIQKAATTTTAVNATTVFSDAQQNVTLDASVTSSGGTVNEGIVTFQLKDGATNIGTAVTSPTVSAEPVSVSYTLPAGTLAKTYSIQASYGVGTNFSNSSDTAKTLTIQKASTTTLAVNATTVFDDAQQNVTLNASITSGGGAVNEGTVTFQIKDGGTNIGTAVTSSTVSSGAASVSYTLPANTTAKEFSIQASYSGGPAFLASSDNSKSLTVQEAATAIVAVNATTVYSDAQQNVFLNASVTSGGGIVNEGAVTFRILDGATLIGAQTTSSTVSSGSVSVSYPFPGHATAKTYTIEALYSGGTNFAASSDSVQSLTVGKASTVTVAADVGATYSLTSQTVTLNAMVTSAYGSLYEGTVTFQIMDGATIVGTAVTSSILSAGAASASYTLPAGTLAQTYSIQASYSSGPNFLASSDTSRSLTIQKANQTIVFDALPDRRLDQSPFDVNATAGSGNAVTFSATGPATCTSGGHVTLTGAGVVTVTAKQSGDSNWNPAPDVSRSFTVDPDSQTITFGALTGKTFGDGAFIVSASGGASGNPVTFAIAGGPATATGTNGHTITLTGAGLVTVRASQAGNTDYKAAADVDQSFIVDKASQTITFNALADKTFGAAPFTMNATGGASGNPVTFSIFSGLATATGNNGSTITIMGAGFVTVRASQAGNTDYIAAVDVVQSFMVAKAAATITLSDLAQIFDGTPKPATAATNPAGLHFLLNYDGSTQTPQNPGNYAVSASISENDYQGSATGILIINAIPSVAASASPSSGIVGIDVAFTGNGTDIGGDLLSYAWNFGDGNSVSATQNPTHTFTAPGTYTTVVTVSDGKGGPHQRM